jgi:hypothetical protein
MEDGIVISPFECTLSRNIRNTLHYYGNEQTLRVALRYKQYDMVKKILSHIYSIADKNNFQDIFYFMRNCSNFLFEPIYENDIEGFKLILNNIHSFNNLNRLLFGFDVNVMYGHSNSAYSNFIDEQQRVLDINYQHIPTEYNHRYYNNYIKYNLITYALIVDSKKMINNWNWAYSSPTNLINNDFSVVNNCDNGNNCDIKITITQRYLDYLNIQHNLLKTYFNNCKGEFKFFNSIIERISLYNPDILYIPINIANLILAVMYIKDIPSIDLSHRYINISTKYMQLGRNDYTLIEFIKYWLYDIYIHEDLFASPDFVQLLLSYKELGGIFYIR